MTKIAQRIVESLISHEFLYKGRKEEYIYVVEVLLEKAISFGTLIMLSFLFKNVLETIVFLFVFMNMRGRTGGFHMSSYGRCWISSIILYAAIVFIIMPLFSKIGIYSYFVFTGSIIIILIISTVNHPNMQLSDLELTESKKVARLIAGIHWVSLTALFFGLPKNKYVLWAMIADIICAILLAMAKLIKQEVI